MTTEIPPRARHVETVREHHGHRVVDPYEWLRDAEVPDVLAHLSAENAYTEARLAHLGPLRERNVREIRAHTQEDDASVPVRLRGWWYFSRTATGAQYRTYHRVPHAGREVTVADVAGPPLPGEQLLLDLNELAGGGDFLRINQIVVSPDDARLVVGVDRAGDERYDVLVVDIARGEVVDDAVRGAFWGLAWSADGTAVTYTRSDESWRPYQVWLHEVGAPAGTDVLLRQEDDERYWTEAEPSRDGRWLVVTHGTKLTAEVWLYSTADLSAPPVLVAPRTPGLDYAVAPAGDHLLVVHNRDLADFEVAWATLTEPGEWHRVLASEPGGRILDVDAFAGHAVVECRRDGYADVVVLPREDGGAGGVGGDGPGAPVYGAPVGVDLPGEVRTLTPGAMRDFDTTEVRVVLESLLTPATTLAWDPATGVTRELHRLPVPGYDPGRYVERRTWATAADGTRVPISLAYRSDLVGAGSDPVSGLDRTAPGYLYGYGSYEVSTDPVFSAARLSLLDRGVVCAYAHIRGGGELGRRWYDEGKLLAKATTFADFVACADHLAEHWVDGDRIAAEGGSAGGLLIGAAVNLAPGRFRAVHAAVAFVDALTTILDPSLPLTAQEWEEWGNPLADPEAYRVIAAYTPYENVRAERYPAILATTSLNDTRVMFVEPAKWVARLRETVTNDPAERPILLRCEMVAGHGGRSGRYDAWADRARELAFLLNQLGVTD